MKIKQLTFQSAHFGSFHIRRDKVPQNHNIWHYHEELELTLILRGQGRLFVGDCTLDFGENDMVLVGSNIPHYWLFNRISSKDTEHDEIDCIVAHFKQDFLGEEFMRLPEAKFLKDLIQEAGRALHSKLSIKHPLKKLSKKIFEQEGILRLTTFLETLHEFKNTSPNSLISESYVIMNQTGDAKRMNTIIEFIRENFTRTIELDELAKLAQMTKNSFSRYFKQKTGKTPMQLIVDLRIAQACQLLGTPDYTMKEICYESGFNNPVSFHKAFKNIKGMTPRIYRNSVLGK